MVRDFDSEIRRAQQEIEELRPRMERAVRAFLDVYSSWLVEFWRKTVAVAVPANPTVVMGLHSEGRRAVKLQIHQLIGDAGTVAQRRLVDEHQALWPHLVPQQEAADAARQRG